MVYDLRESIKSQLDKIVDISFLNALQTIIAAKLPVVQQSEPSINNRQLWETLTNEYAAIDEPELEVNLIYQNSVLDNERRFEFN